jgi:hypothetical protein
VLAEPRTYADVVERYSTDHKRRAEREMRFFKIQPSLQAVVHYAGLAKTPAGKRFNHQRRIPRESLEQAERTLQSHLQDLGASASFEELHDLIDHLIRPIHRIGELMVYDTSLRIAAFRRLEPRFVFLHAGTREGAKVLKLPTHEQRLSVSEVPVEFQSLKPREIEDCLCIYKKALKRIAHDAA